MPSHVSSGSLTTATDAGDVWRPGSLSTVDQLDLQRRSLSLSPNQSLEMPNDQVSTRGDATARDRLFFQSSYLSNGQPPWPANDSSLLRPGPPSPAMMSQQHTQTPSIPSGDYTQMRSPGQMSSRQRPSSCTSTEPILSPDAFGQRSISQPLPSPSSTGTGQDSQRPSISPTQSSSSIGKKNASGSVNEKRRKTKPRRTAHNAIEKRYRIRLNDKIAELRDSIPSLRAQPVTNLDGTPEDEFDDPLSERPSVNKVNKANVLEKATEYVKHLENCNRRLEAELHRILSVSRMNNLERQANSLPNNYAMMEHGHSALLPRSLASDCCTYPVRDRFPGGELL